MTEPPREESLKLGGRKEGRQNSKGNWYWPGLASFSSGMFMGTST